MMKRPRILVVEDETIVAMDIAATLQRLGYDVAARVGTGASAIESALSLKPDLILMDIHLKGPMDGIEAAAIIGQRQPIPVVFLTAHADIDTVERSKAAAPYGYLVKPFDERILHRTVEVALQRAQAHREEHDRTLDALWQSEERFRLLVNAVKNYAVFMIDLDGRIASWNPGAERITGFSDGEVLGKSLAVLKPQGVEGEAIESLFERVRREGGVEWEDLGFRKDGARYVTRMYCAPLLDRKGELLGYASVAADVTEQRQAAEELAQAQRLESLGQLAGGVAHDFNNMLMVIFTRCEVLSRELHSERHRQFISDIRKAAGKNRGLTQQLLAVARRQVLEPEVVNLNDVVDSAMQLLAPTLGEHIDIRQHLAEPLWNVHADPGKLDQVLLNLAINARDAMPGGGTLTIETRNVRVDSFYARHHRGLREGDYVALVVTDNGTGIPAAIRDRIYDPFFTTKEPGRGTGLGLAVVRGIVEQTGGCIWMYSEEGRGTTFKVFLPRIEADIAQLAPDEEMLPGRGGETILLAEDEDLLRTVIREAMEEHGYRVLEARNGIEALKIVKEFAQPIDLLLTDMIMPRMMGNVLAATLREERPTLRVIFMSGYSNQTMRSHAILPPGIHYLEKPIPTTTLLRSIRTALDEPYEPAGNRK